MRQIETIREDQIGPDGKPLRKYEFIDGQTGATGLKFAIGLVIVNVVLVFKDLFFSASKADDKNNLNNGNDEQQQKEIITQKAAALPELVQETETKEKNEVPSDVTSSGSSKRYFAGKTESLFDEAPKNSGTAYSFEQKLNTGSHATSNPFENVIQFPGVFRVTPLNSGPDLGGGAGSSGPVNQNNNSEDDDTTSDDTAERNRLPMLNGAVVFSSLYVNQSIILAEADFLRGAYDLDEDALAINNLIASRGTIEELEDGKWQFIPDPYDLTDITFHYEISDGTGAVQQIAHLSYTELPGGDFVGTEENDVIVGSGGRDKIEGLSGNDTILSREAADLIDAGPGDDRIVAGEGDDVIYAGLGNDVVFGGTGNDLIFGGAGDDVLMGEEGDDEIFGDAGNDQIFGGIGNDKALGGLDNDKLEGNEGNDFLDGEQGADEISGGSGNDILIGGTGDDNVKGDSGDDLFIALSNDGDDHYDGGDDVDTLDLSAITSDTDINLATGTASGAEIGTDEVLNFENVVAGRGNDTITANENVNSLWGNFGEDIFVFLSGNNSGKGSGHRDRIEDFEVGDKIDISLMDGNQGEDGLQRLSFKYDQAEFDGVGQVLYKYENNDTTEFTLLRFKYDEDDLDEADFEIEITGRHVFTEDNLIT